MGMNPMPAAVAKLMRGEIDGDHQWAALTALGLDYYRMGRVGDAFEPVTNPGGLPEATWRINKFLLCCWTQGQEARQ